MRYIISNKPVADLDRLSELLYQISRPLSVRDPEDVTTHLVGYIVHPVDGRVALEVPDDLDIPVHPGRQMGELISLYASIFGNPNRLLNLGDNINNGKASVNALLPVQDAVDKAILDADGWFPENELL